jgi:hypothetical protein
MATMYIQVELELYALIEVQSEVVERERRQCFTTTHLASWTRADQAILVGLVGFGLFPPLEHP